MLFSFVMPVGDTFQYSLWLSSCTLGRSEVRVSCSTVPTELIGLSGLLKDT